MHRSLSSPHAVFGRIKGHRNTGLLANATLRAISFFTLHLLERLDACHNSIKTISMLVRVCINVILGPRLPRPNVWVKAKALYFLILWIIRNLFKSLFEPPQRKLYELQ